MKFYFGYFFFGDGVVWDYDGYMWIKGWVDDVINVFGYWFFIVEVEFVFIFYKGVVEIVVVGCVDDFIG